LQNGLANVGESGESSQNGSANVGEFCESRKFLKTAVLASASTRQKRIFLASTCTRKICARVAIQVKLKQSIGPSHKNFNQKCHKKLKKKYFFNLSLFAKTVTHNCKDHNSGGNTEDETIWMIFNS
jgi:hypothetical protein